MANTSELGTPEIVVTTHDVTVCGTLITRPASIAPSQWLRFWDFVTHKEIDAFLRVGWTSDAIARRK